MAGGVNSTSHVVGTAAALAGRIEGVLAARGLAYGAPEDCLGHVAFGWNWWLRVRGVRQPGKPLDAFDVAVMNAIQKLARLGACPGHEDSALDGAAFILMAAALAKGAPQA